MKSMKTIVRPRPEATRRGPALKKVGARPSGVHRVVRSAMTERALDDRCKYVYCIVRASGAAPIGLIGVGSESADVHAIPYRDIAALVSDTSTEVHEPTRPNVLAHKRVNDIALSRSPVIPMSFGTVCRTREDVIDLLKGAYDAFDDVLTKVQDKVEFGLKAQWDRDVVLRELEGKREDIRRLREEISTPNGSTFFARMRYGRMVDEAMRARSERLVADIFDRLRPFAFASRANRPLRDRMLMDAAFLVSREREAAFGAAVRETGAAYGALSFTCTGPRPPYHFVNIRLKLERPGAARA